MSASVTTLTRARFLRATGALIALPLQTATALVPPLPTLNVVPQPLRQEILPGDSGFALGAATHIVVEALPSQRSEATGVARLFAEWLHTATGLPISVSDDRKPGSGAIVLSALGASASLASEGYTLTIRSSGIVIRAAQLAGLFYGTQTLRQLFPPVAESGVDRPTAYRLPAVEITDAPRFRERSLLLDSSRHMQSIAYLKRTLDLMAYHKLNVFHWHLTDDQGWRIEIPKYPKLTTVGAWRVEEGGKRYGGFYTQTEIRDLVAYARQRYITILPEIDMPAHIQSALAAYPDLACVPGPFLVSTAGVSSNGRATDDVLCVCKESSFRFVTDVLEDVIALFPSREIHIGGDECPTRQWKTCPICQARIKKLGLKDETALQNDFTNRVAAYLATKGRRLQGWNEILNGGTLAQNVVMEEWNGADPQKNMALASDAGLDTVYAYVPDLYLNKDRIAVPMSRVYATNPLTAKSAASLPAHLLGIEACLWGELLPTEDDADAYLWPRAAAMAEAAWSQPSVKNWGDFDTRLHAAHLERIARLESGLGASPARIAERKEGLLDRTDLKSTEIGRWSPAQMSETPVHCEWEITDALNRPGHWIVSLKYRGGSKALVVSDIAIVRRDRAGEGAGVVVAFDRHEGRAGVAPKNNVYRLNMTTYDPLSRYALRLALRSDGGTDSSGAILLFAPPG